MLRVVLVTSLVAACAAEPAPLPDTAPIGTWRYLPHDPTRTPVEERETVELRDDGAYAIRDRRGVDTGTYRIDGNDLTIESSAGGKITTGFAATDDLLIVDALFPARDDMDLVGTWTGTQSSDGTVTGVTLVLRDDGSARIEQTGTYRDAADARWFYAEPYVVVTLAGSTRGKAMPVLPGVAIGDWLYERVAE